jgi:redox-sensitive bicupin YhaK (pirin superfamily)
MGNGSVIRPGDVQRMSAGTGVTHSEFNASKKDPVHFLQIWIVPQRQGIAAGYEQKHFSEAERKDRLRLIASPDAAEGSVTIHQDARVYAALLSPGTTVSHTLSSGRHAWIQVARGTLKLGPVALGAGDGAAVSDQPGLTLTADSPAEVLLFDLA